MVVFYVEYDFEHESFDGYEECSLIMKADLYPYFAEDSIVIRNEIAIDIFKKHQLKMFEVKLIKYIVKDLDGKVRCVVDYRHR